MVAFALLTVAITGYDTSLTVQDYDTLAQTEFSRCYAWRADDEYHLSCLDRADTVVIAPATYQGAKVSRVVVSQAGDFTERLDCHVIEIEPYRVECPEYAKFSSGFE